MIVDNDVVIVDAVRTPIGRYGGALATVRADDLAATVLRALVDRNSLDTSAIDDVIMGCTNQAGEDSRNVARIAALLAGYSIDVPGQTVNRLCGSGLQALIAASHAIKAGEASCIIAGGVESMTRAPWVTLKAEQAYARSTPPAADSTIGWRFTNPALPREWTISMGESAENVAVAYGVSREDQDEFALQSQQKTARALQDNRFAEELVPVSINARKGGKATPDVMHVAVDEYPRPETTLDALQALKPAFRKADGTVTAGSSSGINDGAAALLVMSAAEARAQGKTPMARVVSSAVAGVSPEIMGIGPVPAVKKALQRAKLSIEDIQLVELNEAFAAQSIACIRELNIDPAIVNVNGGAIALGHPLGSSGARIATTLVHEMRRRSAQYGLATMCIGIGQGIAVVFELIS